jgi:ubiquinone/menaquinone biosynthesis C-methylase UbiE
VTRALDVACGTGLSTVALSEFAGAVVGTDRSPEMLAAAPHRPGVSFVRALAESLPFPTACFDAVTVCSGIHWFDQPKFFEEVARVLRPEGWVALYDHYFIGEMAEVPEFAAWTKRALDRYPLPPRSPQVGDPRAEVPAGFDKVTDEFSADDIAMTHAEFVDYQLSISNFVAAGERGVPQAELRGWLTETTAPFFDGVSARTVRFIGSLTCLRPSRAEPSASV